ncbi:MAG: hypothetical protein RJA57_104 [Bacteroidota bacterium]|jgi:membrane protein YdbS with pleckstrin-like domain
MLLPEENRFIAYWEYHRNRKKRLIWQLATGLPLAAVLAGGILVLYFSGWYTRAAMQIRINPSGVLVVLAALLGLMIFVVVFSARYRWDMNEQRYRELIAKRDRTAPAPERSKPVD